MIVNYNIENHYIKSISVELTPLEGLILQDALLLYHNELSNDEVDRDIALKMSDEWLDASYKAKEQEHE